LGARKTFSVVDLYLLTARVIWGSDFLFAKIALREVSPMSFAAMRTLISTAVILPFFLIQEKDRFVPFFISISCL
jgi:drug/metabolite transporter (DMT)-like permease